MQTSYVLSVKEVSMQNELDRQVLIFSQTD